MSVSAPVFRALGPLEVEVGGLAVELGPARQRAVLGVLLAMAPESVPVPRLVDELWPEGGPGKPLRNLQVYVSALRAALGPEGGRLVTVGRAYRLDIDPAAVDAAVFADAARAAQESLLLGNHEVALDHADRGLVLWRGEAWQDLRGVPALEAEAIRLSGLRLDLQATRTRALLGLGRHRELVPELESLVARHPLHEDLRGQLMLALHRSGRQSDALAVYATGRALTVEETGLEPGGALQELHCSVLSDDPDLRVDDADVRARRHLPAAATPFVGRRAELAELTALLRSRSRLVTLTGPGGVGKTRLSMQLGHDHAASCTHGSWFVDLASLTDHRHVPQAVAEVLGVEPSGDDVMGPLVAHLVDRDLLLVLDNFEQVDEAAEVVAEILAAGDRVQVLVTSRVPLRIYGEQVRQVGGLTAHDAADLFVERARAADARFDAGRDGPRIERLCTALDHLPLAIELVAARVSELTVTELADRLEARLDLAEDGPRERPDRQRTLRASIAWSLDLLPEAERVAFRRLAVFTGGFQAASATEVCDVPRERLSALVRASLVVRDEARFSMLETIREYALELLATDADEPGLRRRHATHLLALAEQARPGMSGTPASVLIGRLHEERANLRSALQHLEDTGADVDLLRLAAALTVFWFRTAPSSPDVEWASRALARAPDADPHLRARALYGLGICRSEQGRTDEGIVLVRESQRLFREAGDDTWATRTLNSLSGSLRDLGRLEEAVPLMDEGIALRKRLADPGLPVSIALENRALAAIDQSDFATAGACLAESRALCEQPQASSVDLLRADLALEEGQVCLAQSLLATAVPILREHGVDYRLIESLESFAFLAACLGRAAEAAVLVAAAEQALVEAGSVQVAADALLRQRRLESTLAGLSPAERADARAQGSHLSLDQALDLALDRLTRIPP